MQKDPEEYDRIKPLWRTDPDLRKKGHAEVVGLLGQVSGDAIVIETLKDIDQSVFLAGLFPLFSQTTKNPGNTKTADKLRILMVEKGLIRDC